MLEKNYEKIIAFVEPMMKEAEKRAEEEKNNSFINGKIIIIVNYQIIIKY